ncbi:MAG: PAS domain S-box protein [Archangium sp.]|nr:PAS domain S-box protein [Archangium sp.]MDP3156631.1 PAS domain S-box protein [Archangium sp.]MDP3576206.1 PAS domain S-box protein [Archangium sp.]
MAVTGNPRGDRPPVDPAQLAQLVLLYGVGIASTGAVLGFVSGGAGPAEGLAFVFLGLGLIASVRNAPAVASGLAAGAILSALFGLWQQQTGVAVAVCLVLHGVSLGMVATRLRPWAIYLSLVPGAFALWRGIAFLYGLSASVNVSLPIPMPLVVLLVLFAQAMGGAAPTPGLLMILSPQSPMSLLMRRLMLAVTSAPIVVGFLLIKGKSPDEPVDVALFATANVVILVVLTWWQAGKLLAAEADQDARERWLSTTLSSIGDAVIATDTLARVVRINPVAAALTGWAESEALGRPLAEVFHIISEDTRQRVEHPAAIVLRDGVTVGLANHTLLVSKDGQERPIADSGAPIRASDGAVQGVVMVRHRPAKRRGPLGGERTGRRRGVHAVSSTRREPGGGPGGVARLGGTFAVHRDHPGGGRRRGAAASDRARTGSPGLPGARGLQRRAGHADVRAARRPHRPDAQ